jgi:nucleoid DNA-binding protein
MDKYLLEILKDVNTIIIPGLGALTITNIDTGEIMFMGFLKHDDGQLSKYIAEKESWDENEAKNLIAKYVREITLKLDQGESYDMYEFGSFVKNEDGEIEFRNWEQGDSSKTDESKTEIESKSEVPEPEIKEDIEEESKKEVIESQVIIPAPETEKVEERKEEVEQEEPAEPTKVEVKAEEPESKKADITEEKKEEKPTPVVATASKKDLTIVEREAIKKGEEKLESLRKQKEEQNKEKKRRGAGFYILLVLVAAILSGGTYFALNYNEMKQHIPFLADKEEPTESIDHKKEMEELLQIDETEDEIEEGSTDSEMDEATPESEELDSEDQESLEEDIPEEITQEPEEEKIEPTITTSSNGSFHIIAGAFSSAENAERFGNKMRDEGYTVKVGPGKGMSLVSIGSYPTRSEAENALSSVRNSHPGSWVYEWK